MHRLILRLYSWVIVSLVCNVIAVAQGQPVWPTPPLPAEVPVLQSNSGFPGSPPRSPAHFLAQQQPPAAPTQIWPPTTADDLQAARLSDWSRPRYGYPPSPAIQPVPNPVGSPAGHLRYPGQLASPTLGATPWPYSGSATAAGAHVMAPIPADLASRVSREEVILSAPEAGTLKGLSRAKVGSRPTLFAAVDLLYWQLRRRDLDYAITSLPGAQVIREGEIHELEHPSDSGFRTILGFNMARGWQIGFGYTMYDSVATGQAEDGTGTLFATRTHPDANRRAGLAIGNSSFDLRILDLEVRNTLAVGDRAELALFGSFRWADIQQGFLAEYDGVDFPSGGSVTSLLDTQAFGVRIGADGKWALSDHFYLVGTGETSLLFSDNSLTLEETEGATTILDVADRYEQALPVIGTRVGAGYQRGSLQIEMGYEMQAWLDLGDRLSFLDDQHPGVFSHSNHNVLMDGYYLRLGWGR